MAGRLAKLFLVVALLMCSVFGVWHAGQIALSHANSSFFSLRHSSAAVLSQSVSISPWAADIQRQSALFSVKNHDYHSAFGSMERSVLLRPTWPYDWLLYSYLLAANSNFDDRMDFALSQLRRFGFEDHSLQYDAAVFLLGYWYHLSEAQRSLLVPMLEAVLHRKRDARNLYFEMERLNRDALFCRRLVGLVEYGPAWCAIFEKRKQQRRAGALK